MSSPGDVIARFTVPGPPRAKKNNSRLFAFGKPCALCKKKPFTKIAPSKPWMKWLKFASDQKTNWAPTEPVTERVNVRATFYMDAARKVDACNLFEGLADVLEQVGVVDNDVTLVSWDGSRVRLDRPNPRTEVVLEVAEHDAYLFEELEK